MLALLVIARPADAIISWLPAPVDINDYLGAYTFYNRGYFGQRATIANIEAGFIWDGHETMDFRRGGILYFSDPSINATVPQYLDAHATAVGQVIGGFGFFTYQYGLALGVNLWSGAIATSFIDPGNGQFGGAFNTSQASQAGAYYQATVAGVSNTQFGNGLNFGTADVISSSWGSDDAPGGDSYTSVLIDALANRGRKLIVVSAGNGGPAGNSIGGPANGFNALSVGALTQSRAANGIVDFDTPADFSSRGPQDVFIPTSPDGSTGYTVRAARNRIDISAPGDNLVLAAYGGRTGGNQFASPANVFPDNNLYYIGIGGTSVAAPIVSSGAALLVDVARDRFASNANALDGRTLKAVLLNSADKTSGWSNGATVVSGVSITNGGLDPAVGTGRVNLDAAYRQFTTGTTDLPGVAGGPVAVTGWDAGLLAAGVGSTQDYAFTAAFDAGQIFRGTLAWYASGSFDPSTLDVAYGSFFDLDLQLYLVSPDSTSLSLVAESNSPYDSVEHLYFPIPVGGRYLLRVINTGAVWNFSGDTSVAFSVAWDVPEPLGASILLLVPLGLLRQRR